MRAIALACRTALAGTLVVAGSTHAANAEFQSFFFTVCSAPTGALATRCGETPNGLGNLSGDSESSLNPSQWLSQAGPAIGLAQTRSNAARERGERLRDEGETVVAAQQGPQLVSGAFSLLVNVHATWFERKADSSTTERGFDGDSRALEIGADYRISPRTMVGAILGIERMEYDFDAENAGVRFTPAPTAGSADTDDLYLTLFGTWGLGAGGFIEASAGYEQSDGTYQRNSVFQESTRTRPQVDVRISGQADGTVIWAGVNGGYDFAFGASSLGPYAGITVARSERDAYNERDSASTGLGMRFASGSRDSQLAHLGVRASHAFSSSVGVFVPQLRVEYQHEFEDAPARLSSRYLLDAADTTYTQVGGSADRDSVNLGLSLVAILPGGWNLFADYSTLLANDAVDRQRATLGLRREF